MPKKPTLKKRPERKLRGPSNFTRNDLKRAVRSAKEAGLSITSIEVSKTGAKLIIGGEVQSETELDRELSDWEARRGQG